MKSIKLIFRSVAFFIMLFLMSCTSSAQEEQNNQKSENYEALLKTIGQAAKMGNGTVNFIAAAAISTPSVVHIKTTVRIKTYQRGIFDFFGNEFVRPQFKNSQSSGSGVILSADGYIITNNHVVSEADKIEVTLNNKISYPAKLIGRDPDTDLALIKIEESGLQAIQIANSDSVLVGEWVLAVGNPFNLESTVTQGIVSAKGRSLQLSADKRNTQNPIESFIQTDAAVNPGNSGGALVNLQGKLIGINTAIASPTGTYAGYAFAVPSNLVFKVFEDLKEFGIVQRAYIGVNTTNIDNTTAKNMKLNNLNGALVKGIVSGSSAAEAKIQVDDIIKSVNEIPINSTNELMEQVSKYRPSDKITLDILRNGKPLKLNITLKSRNNSYSMVAAKSPESIGIQVSDLTNQEVMRFRIGGARVSNLSEELASRTELKPGFIITSVNDIRIKNAEEFYETIGNTDAESIVLEGFYPNRPYTYRYTVR